MEAIIKQVDAVKEEYKKGTSRTYDWRLKQLKQLRRMVADEEQRWHEAMSKDLQQTEFLKLIETKSCLGDIDNAIANLWSWMKPEKRSNTVIANIPGSAYIHREPFGVALIISPWNYPVQLLIRPLVGAIAAGNAVILKPSEVSANCSNLFAELTPKYLDNKLIKCIEGGIPETTELLKQRWDYIFYTGNTSVGKIVMKAASEYLTPVTLELGGKSPCIIDENVNLDVACKRIIWGKMLNCGQSCIAPDYLLVHKNVEGKLVAKLQATLKEFYGNGDLKENKFISRIINTRHTERIAKLIDASKEHVVIGGKYDIQAKFVEPTVFKNPGFQSPVMADEIFGPLLPMFTIQSIDEAIKIINEREKPLALYIFSTSTKTQQYVLNNTTSGGVCINDTMLQFTVPDLPFGGVGHSGMGAYNGRDSFETFSHKRAVLDRPTFVDLNLRYPPYGDGKVAVLRRVLGKSLPSLSAVARVAVPAVVAIGSAAVYYYSKL